MSDEILSLPRMARQMGISIKWLKDQANCGNVPCLKVGRKYLFNPAAVRSALALMASATYLQRDRPVTDEMERLENEIKRLRTVLQGLFDACYNHVAIVYDDGGDDYDTAMLVAIQTLYLETKP